MAVWSSVDLDQLSSDFRLDAEHYKPEYLSQDAHTAARDTAQLARIASVSDGNHLSIATEFDNEGVRYLRGQDLSDFFISDADPIYIPESSYKALARSHMFPGDVLVGIVGTIGTVGLVTERHGRLTGNCKLAIVRPRQLPGEYIAAYLASSVGQNEIRRRVRGAVQMGLILPDLKQLPIVQPSAHLLGSVVALVKRAEALRQSSLDVMKSAEDAVTDLLGLGDFDTTETLCYEASFDKLSKANRFGAEFFMPCKERMLNALREQSSGSIGLHFHSAKDLIDPARAARMESLRNFDLADALTFVLDNRCPETPGSDLGSTKKVIESGDIVISKLRSYLRQIALVRVQGVSPAVASTEFIVLRHKGKTPFVSTAAFLIFLRGTPVQTILKWSQDGSQHPRFTEDELLSIPIPDKLREISPLVETLFDRFLAERKEADECLRKASSLIEQGVLASSSDTNQVTHLHQRTIPSLRMK